MFKGEIKDRTKKRLNGWRHTETAMENANRLKMTKNEAYHLIKTYKLTYKKLKTGAKPLAKVLK